mmetsp:Transcript_33824/g.95932  ORF Transcript_33824/g.95932 Transcript_33824/m.95932 type:complete len:343 (+) Transcript_33824:287-1315(+)
MLQDQGGSLIKHTARDIQRNLRIRLGDAERGGERCRAGRTPTLSRRSAGRRVPLPGVRRRGSSGWPHRRGATSGTSAWCGRASSRSGLPARAALTGVVAQGRDVRGPIGLLPLQRRPPACRAPGPLLLDLRPPLQASRVEDVRTLGHRPDLFAVADQLLADSADSLVVRNVQRNGLANLQRGRRSWSSRRRRRTCVERLRVNRDERLHVKRDASLRARRSTGTSRTSFSSFRTCLCTRLQNHWQRGPRLRSSLCDDSAAGAQEPLAASLRRRKAQHTDQRFVEAAGNAPGPPIVFAVGGLAAPGTSAGGGADGRELGAQLEVLPSADLPGAALSASSSPTGP